MLRRAWQSTMIHLARSSGMTGFMQRNRATSLMARKFVAGTSAEAAVKLAAQLQSLQGIRSSLYYLGEYVNRPDLVAENVAEKLVVIQLLAHTALDVHVSVDPTQIGQSVDGALARNNALRIAERLRRAAGERPGVHCMMFDMEDASLVDATIALHDELKRIHFPVALTLQAYLKRTAADLQAQVEAGSRVRLVKGAFVGSSDAAYTTQEKIKLNYRSLVELMFSPKAKAAGFYPIIATHDERIHELAVDLARRNGWRAGQYEFEMLLGVRSDVAQALARGGERVRVYVPFGRDWWPYAVRRIGENPRNALLLARSLFS
jgi:proline dehydrogenase